MHSFEPSLSKSSKPSARPTTNPSLITHNPTTVSDKCTLCDKSY
jgi:hypothetical protein